MAPEELVAGDRYPKPPTRRAWRASHEEAWASATTSPYQSIPTSTWA